MRTARTTVPGISQIPVADIWKKGRPIAGHGKADHTRPRDGNSTWKITALFGLLFFAGYMVGILKGRSEESNFGKLLAAYYMEAKNFSLFTPLFWNEFGSAFLQAVLVLACGFSALGSGFLCLYFAARGAVWGLCASSVFMQGGTRALVIHWLLTCLPDLSVFLVMLWLAMQAHLCASGILRGLTGSSQLRLTAQLRKLLIRFFTVVALCAGFCMLGAASGVLFAGVLI